MEGMGKFGCGLSGVAADPGMERRAQPTDLVRGDAQESTSTFFAPSFPPPTKTWKTFAARTVRVFAVRDV